MLELSSTAIHDREQANAAFREAALILGDLRSQLVDAGFSNDAAESMCEIFFVAGLEH